MILSAFKGFSLFVLTTIAIHSTSFANTSSEDEVDDFEEVQITAPEKNKTSRTPDQSDNNSTVDADVDEDIDDAITNKVNQEVGGTEPTEISTTEDESTEDDDDNLNESLADNDEEDEEPPAPIQNSETIIGKKSNPYSSESRFVPHPNAAKGLIKITKDRVYVYKAPPSKTTRAISVKFGLYEPVNLTNPNNSDLSFGDYYEDTSAPIVLFDYEWKLTQGWFGRFGLKAGSGIYAATGNGRFENTSGLTPEEQFTFLLLPNNLSLAWQGQFSDGQYFMPILEAGIDPFVFSEIRDDDTGPKFGLSLAFHSAAGMALSLTAFDDKARRTLAREYGIHEVWIAAELRSIFSISKDFDFSNTFANLGFIVEY